MTLKHDYEFDDESTFQSALGGDTTDLAAMRDGWIADLKQGDRLVIHVPHMPARALVLREKLEALLGQSLVCSDVLALPLDL